MDFRLDFSWIWACLGTGFGLIWFGFELDFKLSLAFTMILIGFDWIWVGFLVDYKSNSSYDSLGRSYDLLGPPMDLLEASYACMI